MGDRDAGGARLKLVQFGAGITRVIFHFGFMETPDGGLKLTCREPELHGIDPPNITYYLQ
jgi:KUP system potassium uptake protein